MEESRQQESNRTGKLPLNTKLNDRVIILKDKIRQKKTLKYFWKSSVPSKWNELSEKTKILQFKDTNGKSRDTLTFLKESQKYIYQISKPKIIPTSSFKRDIVPVPTKTSQIGHSNIPKLDLIRLKIAMNKVIADENPIHVNIQPLKSAYKLNSRHK